MRGTKSYYAGVYRGDKLVDVVRYHSDRPRDAAEVYSAWRIETNPWYWPGNMHFKPIHARDVGKYVRKVLGLRPYERFFGEIAWIGSSPSYSVFASTPEIITHY